MSHNQWMGMDLNSPHPESNMHPRPPLPAGANPKKKRRTNAKATTRSQQATECPSVVQLQNLRPPPLSCFGDTVSVANPFDDIMPRSSRGMMELCNMSQMHPSAQQQMCGPPMRGMNPMSSMGGMRAMMPHNMGAMNQMGNHMSAMGGMSTMTNPPAGRMSPLNNMGSNQPPGAMNQMGNHMNPMGGLSPLSNSGRMSPMGSNQPPGAMNPMGNHMNPMGGMLPMSHSPVGRMSPMGPNQPPGAMSQMGNHMNPMGGMSPMSNPAGRMSPMNNMGPNQPPGAMHQMGNHISQMGGMPPMGNPPGGRMSPMSHMRLNQPPGAMNPMGSHMNPMGGMAPMGNPPMGRMSPMSSMGGHMNQSHMAHMTGNQMGGRAMDNPMGRPSVSPMNRMPVSIQNHMANGTMNGPSSMNDFNGLFGQNGSQPHNMGINGHMNMANLARQINGPRATMGSMAPSNINVTGRNANYAHHNQIGGHMSSMTSNNGGAPPMGHPLNPGVNIGPHGFQARPGTRLMTPSSGKIYPPDQSMVFNSQNRNAPPIYLCGNCHKEVNDNDQGIVCESGCNFWFHRMCVGLTEAAFQLLTKEVYAEWVCDKCLKMKKVPPVKFRT